MLYIATIRDMYTKAIYKVAREYRETAIVLFADNDDDAQEIAINTFCNVARTQAWRFFDTTCACCASVDFRFELFSSNEDLRWHDTSFAEFEQELAAYNKLDGYTTIFAATNNGLHDYRDRKYRKPEQPSFRNLACNKR